MAQAIENGSSLTSSMNSEHDQIRLERRWRFSKIITFFLSDFTVVINTELFIQITDQYSDVFVAASNVARHT
jgi:hypothetical protein